jgi:hypothetical protein
MGNCTQIEVVGFLKAFFVDDQTIFKVDENITKVL